MFILAQAIIQNDATVLNARNTELISNKDWTTTDGGMDDNFVLPEVAGNA